MIKILSVVQLCTFCNTIRKMLSTNVLCMKKRKKRSYYISEASDYIPRPSKDKRSLGDSPAMMQITEDTPPDMLAGAMDLTVHLPTGRTVKMSVERSTPMMDLLVQITTAHHLQHSGHIIQALEMAPTSGNSDKILPYKPNTPIGALDTQHVKVIPKNRSVPVPKPVSVGHQPFESTFRLQVHLPRNQLYVIRVSQNVHLEDIMKKVCEEKNLDSVKYEFRHPGNLDEVLDPKLTLSDYQITEVYIVSKGTVGLTQAFSSSDIMALRKEEERKQLQARTGGGVFSLIFKRGKPSMGSGSLSSENRSISPSHSDDSRSVTPPAIQQQILPPVPQEPQPPLEKPKPPQRKRRPAPKPPQQSETRKDSTDKPPSQISNVSDTNTSDIQQNKVDNGLTICHSRNSSDSSGYHEPSVLSDNCNTSLPRRPKSTVINEVVSEEVQSGEHSRSNGNLSKMATFSKSTTSITSRKKKAAPPPPPVLKSESLTTNSEKASPVVASPLVEKRDTNQNQSKTDVTVNEDASSDVTIKSSSSDNQIKSLQSLEVMRLIQTKLNTPSNSTEQLLNEENSYKQTSARNSINEEDSSFKQIRPRNSLVEQDGSFKQTSSRNSIVEQETDYKSSSARSSISLEHNNPVPSSKVEPESTTNTKTYRYQGPPAINLSTWSERPKTKVSLKEDTDYKINSKDNYNSNIKLNTSLSNGNIEIRHYSNNSSVGPKKQDDSNNVSIKVNGTGPIMTQQSGNVVIKIGESQAPKLIDKFSSRFINHTTAVGYRKPLANINKIDKAPRPHSVAFDTDFDISRVPIVRAVELKKPFKETPQTNNTSVTQINSINNETTNKYADIYRSSESINEINGLKQTKNSSVYLSSDSINKPVLRVNSFAQNRPGPVVTGFRGPEVGNDNTARSRKSWNVPNSYSTLPLKVNPELPAKSTSFVPNSNVPFSHITLKRIDANKVPTVTEHNNTNTVFGKVVLRNTSAQIKANNNNRFSTGSPFGLTNNFETNKTYLNGLDSKEAPPPPPLMPKVTSVTKKAVKSPEHSIDSRGELLDSIRNFGGMKGLRHAKA